MLKKAKTRQTGKRIMSWFMTIAMLLSLIGIMPETASAAGTGASSYVFDMGELSSYVGTTFEKKEYTVPGNDFFTFIGEAKLAINTSEQTFSDGYKSTHRFNPGGGGDTTRRSIKFTTTGKATVKVYWIAGGDGREMYILNSAGETHAKTAEGSTKNSLYISTMEITAAGTYYLCGKDGSNYIYRVEVTPEPTVVKNVFDMGELSSYVGTTFEKKEYTVPGNDFFTFIGEAKLAINTSEQTFSDGYKSTHRFNPGGGGDTTRRSIKFTTTGKATVKVYWIAGGDGREMYILNSAGETHAKTAEGSTKNSLYISTMEITAAGTYFLCGKDGSNYIYRVEITQDGGAKEPAVDTVTAVQDITDESGATVTISFKGKAGEENTKYTVEASKDGTEWIKVGTADGTKTEGSVEVNLCDEKLGFGTWKFRVNGVEATNTITYAAKTYTLTGSYNSGLIDASVLTGIEFVAQTDSIWVPEVTINTTAHTYTAVLEKGTTYKVVSKGTNDYDMTTPEGTIVYYEDTTLNIEFNKIALWDITIALGSTPDLSGKNISYTFTHADGTVYKFVNASNIQLRDGVYTVALGGDFAQYAYTIKKGDKLTVSGADVTHAITFAEKTSWSFAPNFDKIEGTTGWFYGIKVDATNGKLATNGDNCCAAFNAGTILKVPVSGACSITVTSHQKADSYANYTINGIAATKGEATVEYTGEAGYVEIVSTGASYISAISISYPEKEVEEVEQPIMPFVPELDTDATDASDADGNPKGNNPDKLNLTVEGQKLIFNQIGGRFYNNYASVSNIGYYLFPMTSDANTLEFDVVITGSRVSDKKGGFTAGLFTNNHIYTLGFRNGNIIRGLYSKDNATNNFAGAGSPNEETVPFNTSIHYVISIIAGKPTVTVSWVDDAGVTQERTWAQNPVAETANGEKPTEYYYGLMFGDTDAIVTNMVYTSEEGHVLYDQNACYKPMGSAPVANNVTAVAAESREYIDIFWAGTVPEFDGTYVVEMQKNDGEWVELTQDVTGFTYRYKLPAGDGGNYKFRVCGQLGKKALGGTRNDYATMTGTIYVKGALEKPVVTLAVKNDKIVLNWQKVAGAEYYKVYRYATIAGAASVECIAEKVTTNTYTDSNVKADVPYYYTVIAISETDENQSPMSEEGWTMVASEREGEYVYEKEATGIVITKKPYDTVFSGTVKLEGVVFGKGTIVATVNGVKVASKDVKAREEFKFDLTLTAGRNDVNLFFTDENKNITRETFNFVYLTNYDVVVDSKYTGVDGELVNGIPTYKTIQAAVNAVGAAPVAFAEDTSNIVILVLAGSYEERLVVNTPNITLIGEDKDNTVIHCYPGDSKWGLANGAAGGDMEERCATVIKSGATGFSAENISFANDYVFGTNDGKDNKSADAIRVEADQSSFVNVKFESVQDTLYMHSGKQYYYKCEIRGLVDFIYSGDAAKSYFNDCDIVFVYEPTKNQGYVCAPKTAENSSYGLIFNNCSITSEEGCTGTKYYLARPWGATAAITFVNCYMGDVLNAYEPYSDMSGNMHENARFYEYGSYGPGYAVNADRRQLTKEQIDEMLSNTALGWNPETVVANAATAGYVGTIVTDRENYATAEVVEDKYLWSDGDDNGLKMYDMEGYAAAFGVTGGGLLLPTNTNYYQVSTANAFLDALLLAKNNRQNTVIQVMNDINLGYNEIQNAASYDNKFLASHNPALTHPTLKETGVSKITLDGLSNVTIFSLDGSSIKHAGFVLKNSENIVIRNLKFDEFWEWDEATSGDYDVNDWDFITLDTGCDGIWIDHCTFYKAYDGIIDIKNPAPKTNVTISWCEFLPGSEDNVFFNEMMDYIKAHPSEFPTTYQHMKEAGMTDKQIWWYAYGQKKTHLLGQADDVTANVGIQVTLANNYYKNSMDRMPRLRYGYAHVYNCIMDSQNLLDIRLAIADENLAKKIVSNGAASTCGAQMLLENCYISGIQNPLNSGNGSSPSGYINAINSLYYMNGKKAELAPKCNTTGDTRVLVTDANEFIANLPYSDYNLYDAKDLKGIVPYYAGAGKLELTALQWEKTSYNAVYETPTVNPPMGDLFDAPVIFMITLLGAAFVAAGFFGKKKFAVEE